PYAPAFRAIAPSADASPLTLISSASCYFFFFNDPATTATYTLSLHDALPIYRRRAACTSAPTRHRRRRRGHAGRGHAGRGGVDGDRKSTRLNSSHLVISYAVFCLKKKTPARVLVPDGRPLRGWRRGAGPCLRA